MIFSLSIRNELLMAYDNQHEIENLIELSKKICYSKATIEDVIWENNEKNNLRIHWEEPLKLTNMSNLKDIKSEIEKYANDSNLTELQIVKKLEKHYFDKEVNKNLTLYKKGKKKVSEITKDLKISPRKFYAILEKKKIEHKKYKKE
ncbi:hypothetical protein [Polaribacter sp. R2A056_3_33]|uniref:hypothetical protein n=1 Tax=Polaribacter sp. R2A056_3_33 TaxID=2745563 RepID=UPI0020C7E256|nr:hypothetical protein [Polaribacter sp. R2A056_3_33]